MKKIYWVLSTVVAPVLNFALAALLAYQAASVILVWYDPQPPTTRPPLNLAPAPVATAATFDSTRLIATQVFGHPAPAAVAVPTPTSAPQTRIDLRLRGVLADAEGRGVALIRLPGGENKLFSIGQGVSANIVLHSIYPDKVLLLRNGQHESLYLEGKNTDKHIAQVQPNVAPPAADSQRLSAYRHEILRKPEDMARYLRLQPAREQDNFIGYRVYPGKEQDILGELGLQTGDIVTAVNGVLLDSPLKGLDILQQLAQAHNVHLELLRNGSKLSLNIVLP
jgi:general secretion pathway protein C